MSYEMLGSKWNLINGVTCACCPGGRHNQRLHEREIEVNEGPDNRWYWSVGSYSGEERSKDAAYDRARDVQRRLSAAKNISENSQND